jgi:hypothetical protein
MEYPSNAADDPIADVRYRPQSGAVPFGDAITGTFADTAGSASGARATRSTDAS